LVAVLEREAQQTSDPAIRTQALFRIGRIHGELLGNRIDATSALARAMQSSPSDRLVLDSLARIYEAVGEHRNLANVLAHTVETITLHGVRIGLMHRIALIHEKHLADEEQAQRWYEASLQIDAAYAPSVAALDNLYERSRSWESLIVMHLACAEATTDSTRRAAAHARIAGIFETRVERPEEAMRHHAMALSLDPTLETSFKALVRLYALDRRHRELIELYERGIDQSNEDDVKIAYLFKIGGIYEDHLSDPAQASHAYRRILTIEAKNLGALHSASIAKTSALAHD
jgi:tetratricopeptide (TPR) repeat protein